MITIENGKIIRRYDKELLVIEPWGENSLRIRATQRASLLEDEDLSALLPDPKTTASEAALDGSGAVLTNGKIRAELSGSGKLTFYNQEGKVLLQEFQRTRAMMEEGHKEFNSALEIYARTFEPYAMMDNYALTVRFEPVDGEKIFGLGQYQQPYLDMKGCVLELAHRNSQASVPFALSSNGYGFLWNNPGIGQVTFGKNVTEWKAASTKQMDSGSRQEIRRQRLNNHTRRCPERFR